MTTEKFWTLIDAAKTAGDGSWDERLEALTALLAELPPGEIIAFDRIFREQTTRAYSWNLWGAAFIIGGGCSDDAFIDFRSWLISMGRTVFEEALRNQESLADIHFGPQPGEEEDAFFEEYAYVAALVYEEVTGGELPDADVESPEEPIGDTWTEEDLPQRYPKLWALHA